MTITQRETLEQLKIIRDLEVRKTEESIRYHDIRKDDGTLATASRWLNVVNLKTVHHIRTSTIRALVKQGYLQERSSGGWGPEILIND